MPKAFYKINDFSGGLNSAFDPRDIGENELSDADNIILDERRSVRPMGGDTAHSEIPSGTAGHICPGYGAHIFESDHEKGPLALDTGENWLSIVDAKTGEIDLYDQGSDSFQSNIMDMGTASTSAFSANELAFDGNSSGYDTITADAGAGTGASFIEAGFRKADIIGIAGCTDVLANNLNGLRVRSVTDTVLTLDHSGVLTDEANEAGSVTITRLTQGVFYFADEALRVSDAAFGSAIQNKWYGYIKRRPFQDISGSMEHLNNTANFSSNWASGNGWAADATDATYSHHASPGTLVQATGSMAIANTIPNAIYKFTYTMSGLNLGGDGTLQASITTAHAATATNLTMSNATTTLYYKSASSAGAFTIGIAGSSSSAAFNLDNISLTFYGFDDWHSDNNTLAPPTDCSTHASNYPEAGAGFKFKIESPTSPTGTWDAQTYQLAASFIYDGHQESFLYIPTSNNTFSAASLDSLDIDVRAALTDANSAGSFNPRITGARIYSRVDTTGDPWALLLDISLRDGVRAGLSGEYSPWVLDSGINMKVDTVIVKSPALETYEILNSFPANKDANEKLTISGTGEGYKTAVVANRRAFVANIKTVNEDSETVQMRDRIMYTPIGKFDTFPRSFFIDVVKGDAQEFTKLEEFSDRLLAFKNRKLYIINIASPSPSNWYVEDIKDFVGVEHPYAVTKTDFGICWVNKFGVFIYDGQNVTNLILNKVKESTWQTYFKRDTLIGYNPRRFYLIILKNAFADAGDVYVYDFRTQSWVKGQSAFSDNYNRANMLVDWNSNPTSVYQTLLTGDLYWTSETSWEGQSSNTWSSTSDAYDIKEWTDDMRSVGANKFIVTTRDIDFGEPGRKKKVYGITVTYKSDILQTQPIYYAVDGSSSFSSQLTGNFAGSSDWAQLRAIADTPIECQSIRFKITNPSNSTGESSGLQINDVSVDYRILYSRVS
tara:strand:- start:7269 stop:10115 length:2847 start_codon:yes stop_codon:yes gene_type:complete